MPIKFGDLIENANSSYAVIDLTDNQSRGVAFIDALGVLDGNGISTNLTNITPDKRRQGMLLVDKETAEVYILEGADSDGDDTYTDAEFGTAPGEEGTNWKAVGSLELQTTDIGVNIDDTFNGSGKTFGKYHPGFEQVIGSQGNQSGIVPVAAWMLEKAANPDYSVIASAQGATSLEIIRDALNELFPLNPSLTATGTIEFNQPSGSITLAASCDNVNETTCEGFTFYAREIGAASWGAPINTVPAGSISGANDATTNTWSFSFTHSWDGQENQYQNFEGLEFKVEVTDGLTATGSAEDEVERSDYQIPLISNWSVTRQKANTLYNGTNVGSDNDFSESDLFRVLGNIDSNISFTITPSSFNHSSITDASHTWTLLRKSVGEGAFSNWVQIGTGSFTLAGENSVTINTADAGAGSLSLKTNKVQYAVVVGDVFTANQSFSINNHLANNSALGYWGSKDYQITGQSGTDVTSDFSGDPSENSNYSGNVSAQIRFVPPWFTGYIPEGDFGGGYATITNVTNAQENNVLDYQFGTGDDQWVDIEAHEESPLLLKGEVVPPQGTGQVSGAYQIGAWSPNANARFYILGTNIASDISNATGYSNSSSDEDHVNYATSNPAADLAVKVGSSYASSEVYIGASTFNANTALIGAEVYINIVGRTDAQGAAIENRTIENQYYTLLVGDQVGSVSGAVKIAK